jgi:hypothetical protein
MLCCTWIENILLWSWQLELLKKFWNEGKRGADVCWCRTDLVLFLVAKLFRLLIEVTVSCQHILKEKIILHSEWYLDEVLSWSWIFWWFSPFKYGWTSWTMIHAGCLCKSHMSTGILCSRSYWQNCDSWRCGRSWHFLCMACVTLF